jgi:hypothetical protein
MSTWWYRALLRVARDGLLAVAGARGATILRRGAGASARLLKRAAPAGGCACGACGPS